MTRPEGYHIQVHVSLPVRNEYDPASMRCQCMISILITDDPKLLRRLGSLRIPKLRSQDAETQRDKQDEVENGTSES